MKSISFEVTTPKTLSTGVFRSAWEFLCQWYSVDIPEGTVQRVYDAYYRYISENGRGLANPSTLLNQAADRVVCQYANFPTADQILGVMRAIEGEKQSAQSDPTPSQAQAQGDAPGSPMPYTALANDDLERMQMLQQLNIRQEGVLLPEDLGNGAEGFNYGVEVYNPNANAQDYSQLDQDAAAATTTATP